MSRVTSSRGVGFIACNLKLPTHGAPQKLGSTINTPPLVRLFVCIGVAYAFVVLAIQAIPMSISAAYRGVLFGGFLWLVTVGRYRRRLYIFTVLRWHRSLGQRASQVERSTRVFNWTPNWPQQLKSAGPQGT